MTVVDDRVIELFERLEVPEGYKAELLRGEIVMMAGPDWVHNVIVQAVADQIPADRWHRLQTQDIAIPGEASEPEPDLVVHERGAFEGPGRLVPAPALTLVVEVVSRTSVDRDYRVKRSMYAAGRIPAYLLIDPLAGRCVLFTEPAGEGEAADYRVERTTKFGEPMPVDVLGVSLETVEFRTLT
ncbi:Uma2 family endonuclease [Streptomyces sp. DSM 42041]|uniref:Uma2 family endonuclease n=1 Tax=Streptomyces hazeniae TaxID=3075538 RepID=A0ABU2NN54_9ACTN|nr:Uma2 family endonuclease [Streptomyces sp. DSM 42041]MDT0377492.1 Uma2 family endonuclease [Streptomyces sp. DSM 42041]